MTAVASKPELELVAGRVSRSLNALADQMRQSGQGGYAAQLQGMADMLSRACHESMSRTSDIDNAADLFSPEELEAARAQLMGKRKK